MAQKTLYLDFAWGNPVKEIIIKNGNKTTYKIVPDNWVEQPKDIPSRSMTTTVCNQMALDMTKEEYDAIFHKDTTSPSQ